MRAGGCEDPRTVVYHPYEVRYGRLELSASRAQWLHNLGTKACGLDLAPRLHPISHRNREREHCRDGRHAPH
jgi:hypothetical protein